MDKFNRKKKETKNLVYKAQLNVIRGNTTISH